MCSFGRILLLLNAANAPPSAHYCCCSVRPPPQRGYQAIRRSCVHIVFSTSLSRICTRSFGYFMSLFCTLSFPFLLCLISGALSKRICEVFKMSDEVLMNSARSIIGWRISLWRSAVYSLSKLHYK